MNKKYITIVAVLVIFACGVLYFLYNQQIYPIPTIIKEYLGQISPTPTIKKNKPKIIRPTPQVFNFDFYPIHEIKSNKLDSDTLNTEGYVVRIDNCYFDCPAGASCAPCGPDTITISEDDIIRYEQAGYENDIILINSSFEFELGKKYTFSIKRLNYGGGLTGGPINDFEIVGYSLLLDK